MSESESQARGSPRGPTSRRACTSRCSWRGWPPSPGSSSRPSRCVATVTTRWWLRPGSRTASSEGRCPRSRSRAELADADQWGVWRFVPHDRATEEALAYSHIPDVTRSTVRTLAPPRPARLAGLRRPGRMRGLLSVDSPRDGPAEPGEARGPDAGTPDWPARCPARARAGELAERVRIAAEAREIVRQALGQPTLDLVLQACRSTLVDCFDAVGMWLTAFDEDGGTSTAWYAEGVESEPLFSEIDDVVIELAHRYWAEQYVAPFSGRAPPTPTCRRGRAAAADLPGQHRHRVRALRPPRCRHRVHRASWSSPACRVAG